VVGYTFVSSKEKSNHKIRPNSNRRKLIVGGYYVVESLARSRQTPEERRTVYDCPCPFQRESSERAAVRGQVGEAKLTLSGNE